MIMMTLAKNQNSVTIVQSSQVILNLQNTKSEMKNSKLENQKTICVFVHNYFSSHIAYNEDLNQTLQPIQSVQILFHRYPLLISGVDS